MWILDKLLRRKNWPRITISPSDLDAEIVFDRWIEPGDELDVLQSLLATHAPAWCTKLRIWRGPRDQRPVDISRPGALKEVVLAACYERGPTYRALVEQYGKPEFERPSGSAELRGSHRDLTVVISVDQMVLSPLGKAWCLGNKVAVQLRGATARKPSGNEWTAKFFTDLCDQLSPAWGHVGAVAEYWAKVMSVSPRIEAIGRDFGRYLPGLFWLNFFGRRLCEHVGKGRFLETRSHLVREVDSGVLIGLSAAPGRWDAPEYRTEEARVRQHLGADLFFDRKRPSRHVAVPTWNA
ncbi:MAG TPA: hypothetical protein VGG01_11695 [Xanthobacteraceae bacterium]